MNIETIQYIGCSNCKRRDGFRGTPAKAKQHFKQIGYTGSKKDICPDCSRKL